MVQRNADEPSPSARKPRTRTAPRRDDTAPAPSATAVAAEAYRTGVVPLAPGQGQAGAPGANRLPADRDNEALRDAYVGDEAPGGSMMTPDHGRVDEIGRVMGVQEADSGELRTSSELLDKRDRNRARQDVPDPTTRDIPGPDGDD